MFHIHRWEEIGDRVFTPSPIVGGDELDGNQEVVLTVLYGFTTITERCVKCQKLHFTRAIGDQRRLSDKQKRDRK